MNSHEARGIALSFAAVMCGCIVQPLEADTGAVQGGRPSKIAAVGVVYAKGNQFCSGTLIDARVVLTAKSCLRGVTNPATEISFSTGFGAEVVPAVALFIAGDMTDIRSHHPSQPWTTSRDLAAIVLARDAGTDFRPFRRAPMLAAPRSQGGQIGQPAVLVGWGPSDREGFDHGTRLAAAAPISGISDETFVLDPTWNVMPCYGDFGGPVFVSGEVAGVVSKTFDPNPWTVEEDWLGRGHARNCMPGTFTRVDAFVPIVEQALARAAADRAAEAPTPEQAFVPEPETCACDDLCADLGDCCDACWS